MSYIDRRTGAQFYGLDHVTGTYKTKRFEKEGREELRLKYEYPRDDSYIFTRDWVFESPEVEYADIFYRILTSIYILPCDPFDASETSESYDYNQGSFVYDIFFSCSLQVRKRLEYTFRRAIGEPFINSQMLLKGGKVTRGYFIEELMS